MDFMREFKRPCKLLTDTGLELPLRVEQLDLNPFQLPTITGHLLNLPYELRVSTKDSSPIEKVIFNNPATIVIWKDGTKTIVKCQPGDTYDKELGLALCISKKYFGNKGNFNEIFKKWIPEEDKKETITAYDGNGNVVAEIIKEALSIEDMREVVNAYCCGKSCFECPIYKLPERNIPNHSCVYPDNENEVIENYNAIKDHI